MLSLTQAPSGQNHAVFTDRGKSKASIIFLGSVAIIWIFFCIFYPQSYKAAKLLHVTLGTFPPGGSRGGLNPVFLRFLICLTLWALAVLFDSVFICWQIRKCFFLKFSRVRIIVFVRLAWRAEGRRGALGSMASRHILFWEMALPGPLSLPKPCLGCWGLSVAEDGGGCLRCADRGQY